MSVGLVDIDQDDIRMDARDDPVRIDIRIFNVEVHVPQCGYHLGQARPHR
jgi:hypothetical protein